MSRYFVVSQLDTLDGMDLSAVFAGNDLNVDDASFADYLEDTFPSASTTVWSSISGDPSSLLVILIQFPSTFAVLADLASFQALSETAIQFGASLFTYEVVDDTVINSVDPFALVRDEITFTSDLIVGTAGDDTFDALSGNDEIYGNGGNDRLLGSYGDDLLNGGGGADILRGGVGNDILIGGKGKDILNGGEGRDLADYSSHGSVTVDLAISTWQSTGAGRDRLFGIEDLTGGRKASHLSGSGAANTITGGDGDDEIAGRGGDDELFGGGGDDHIWGGAGDDEIRGGNGNDVVRGGSGNDFIVEFDLSRGTTGGRDKLFGGGGDDTIIGNDGNDRLSGGRGGDDLSGGTGNDRLLGGGGDDRLDGGVGTNILLGGAGNDELRAYGRQDILDGGGGNDRLICEGGSDGLTLTGGAGQDEFTFGRGFSGRAVISDFDLGADVIGILQAFDQLTIEGETDATFETYYGGEVVLLGVSASDLSADDFL